MPTLLFATALVGASCSGSSDGTSDADANSGGSGGSAASGGASNTGGQAATGGGSATGGASGNSFTCPTVTPGAVPSLPKTTALLADAPNLPGESEGNGFLEGAIWLDGSLYVSQLRTWGAPPPSRVLKLNGTTLEEFIPDAGTNGLFPGDGELLGASHISQGIIRLGLAAPHTKTVVVDEYDTKKFNSPNDLVVAPNGDIFFTDPTYQCGNADATCEQGAANKRVYRFADGVVSTVASTHDQPNGIALSPDGNTLYVAGSGPLEKFPLADGVPGDRAEFAASLTGIDGLTVDCAGNVYASAHSQQNVAVVKPDGTVLADRITVGANVTNVAFGGPNHTTLYVTTYSKALHSVELDVPGYPY
ncbi:MAG TPA: SMP-30/gluconolactonase/LRE family protein [Polyangiaceae bacterium]|nr:SMP-30/gluconolactonase/LRE family protein [Polyangiaceae bacterium]